MAKHCINFDDENLGCCNCPFCVDLRHSIGCDAGIYCNRETPMKWISYGTDNSEGLIKTPDWCGIHYDEQSEEKEKQAEITKIKQEAQLKAENEIKKARIELQETIEERVNATLRHREFCELDGWRNARVHYPGPVQQVAVQQVLPPYINAYNISEEEVIRRTQYDLATELARHLIMSDLVTFHISSPLITDRVEGVRVKALLNICRPNNTKNLVELVKEYKALYGPYFMR